jgi:glycosyltransferase involved in cell wall biosynthesis
MRAAIYNPYLDTLGGGERYTMAFAQVLKGVGYRVDVEWKDATIKERLENRFGLELKNINFVSNIKRGDGYDVCFWVSDGSIPLLRSRKNILHFQIPFKNINGKTLLNRMKFYRINRVICNSYYTKRYIDREFEINSDVIYPPVSIDKIKPKIKENLIISIGRFSHLTQAKRQDVLIKSFKRIYDSGYKKWRLILAGGVEVGVDNFIDKLKEKSVGYPINILESPSFKELKDLYGHAKIFWSASGFGIDEEKEPQRVEHFGITVVEAMAGGCLVMVYAAGGHKEIVSDSFNGFLWRTSKELILKTEKLMENINLIRKLSHQAKKDSLVYEYERFEAQVLEIL